VDRGVIFLISIIVANVPEGLLATVTVSWFSFFAFLFMAVTARFFPLHFCSSCLLLSKSTRSV
jgi:hypothetical protein